MTIAVIIATKNRPDLLSTRALASITNQTRVPDYLIVCDDSDIEFQHENLRAIQNYHLDGCSVTYKKNDRTSGASGCWNSAIDELLEFVDTPNETITAILDDDDAWHPDYLQACEDHLLENQLDMVAAGIQRIEDPADQFNESFAPKALNSSKLLVTNPGIQGSNLFIRLPALLKAGCFDENLRSSTDRDLCIRLSLLGDLKYQPLDKILVKHYAEANRLRLSTSGSQTKIDGLNRFWKKYSGQMTNEQKLAFKERALDLFSWSPPDISSKLLAPPHNRFSIVLGLPINVLNDQVDLFINKIQTLSKKHIVGLDIVILSQLPREGFDDITKRLRSAGLGCFLYSTQKDLPCDALPLLCANVSKLRPGSASWIIPSLESVSSELNIAGIDEFLQSSKAIQVENTLHKHYPVARFSSTEKLQNWIHNERIDSAYQRVMQRFAPTELSILGSGSEGVVFTDGNTVFKCIDYWKTRIPEEQLEFLKKQGNTWIDTPGIYQLYNVEVDGPWVIITYQYEMSTAYFGGHESDLIKLLEGCTRSGLVCNNIHPKNLIVTQSGVKLIDYGSDIRPWSPLGFEHMVRRAFITSRFALHPNLQQILRDALKSTDIPEMHGYPRFKESLTCSRHQLSRHFDIHKAPENDPYELIVGVITSEPSMLLPLLYSLAQVSTCEAISDLRVLVLDNNSDKQDLQRVCEHAESVGIKVNLISSSKYQQDAISGLFGPDADEVCAQSSMSIATARTVLQRYLGIALRSTPGAIGWILDDDMRLDSRAIQYLPWLPEFRSNKVDVLLGAYEGSSPNPPLNGLRVNLLDLLHNLTWLETLPDTQILPNCTRENDITRDTFPDYYYDLSRKHTAHLETPIWIEPAYPQETVAEARSRLLSSATGILNGATLTRNIIAASPGNPLKSARPSVNRGGCTFILNPESIELTPNTIIKTKEKYARRSDMIWAIINQHYRGMSIKAVSFPVHHEGRLYDEIGIKIEKVQAELIGSALYAALTDFLSCSPRHQLNFTCDEITRITNTALEHLNTRVKLLEISFYRIQGLNSALKKLFSYQELQILTRHIDRSFTLESYHLMRTRLKLISKSDVAAFLNSLTQTADNYAAGLSNLSSSQPDIM